MPRQQVRRKPDQADKLRALSRGQSRGARTLAIASGKGGVGKTSIAVNLAIDLARRGHHTILVDLDMGLANADLLLGIRTRYTLAHVVAGQRTLQEVITKGPEGLRFIPGASGIAQVADMSEFERRNLGSWLEALEQSADFLVLDCGAGIARNVVSFASAADRVLAVTTPQPTALTDAYALIKMLCREKTTADLSLLVNMVGNRSEARIAYHRVAAVAQRFLNYSVADAGYLLHDSVVGQAVRERCPFVIGHPKSNASFCIAAMSDDLARSSSNGTHRGGFFKRVAGLFV